MKRGTSWLLGAVLVAVVVAHLLRDTPGYVVRDTDGGYVGDMTHYVYWTRLITLGGIQSAYNGSWPETYAVYPPVTLYPYWAVGALYRSFEDPSFDADRAQHSLWLHEALKGVALMWHLLTGLAIFLVLRRLAPNAAGIAAAVYIVNPAALYDVAHWAQPDGAHALFSVLAIGVLSLGGVPLAWAAMALAALAKPQAWSLLPLLTTATVRARGVTSVVGGIAVAGATALIVTLPFTLSGHLRELLTLPSTIASVMPVASADAHNLWRLVLGARGQDAIFVQDSAHFFGPLTYREMAGALVVAVLVFSAWLYWTRRANLAEAAALAVLGWFDFTTQAHENHLFFVLPLLALAWPTRRSLLPIYAVLSLTVLLNTLLHDQLVLEALGASLDDPRVESLRAVNAVLNLVTWLAWAAWAALRRPSETWLNVPSLRFGYSDVRS